jgi:hypothetical protein
MKSNKQLNNEERESRLCLSEILANRKQQYNPNKEQQQICSRCRRNNATITIANVKYIIAYKIIYLLTFCLETLPYSLFQLLLLPVFI